MVSAEAIPPLAINGWRIYAHPLFLDQLDALISEVHQLRRMDPRGYRHKNASKRLAAIARLMLQDIPRYPGRKEFLQGSTLWGQPSPLEPRQVLSAVSALLSLSGSLQDDRAGVTGPHASGAQSLSSPCGSSCEAVFIGRCPPGGFRLAALTGQRKPGW